MQFKISEFQISNESKNLEQSRKQKALSEDKRAGGTPFLPQDKPALQNGSGELMGR
jgi:hypothetical protein